MPNGCFTSHSDPRLSALTVSGPLQTATGGISSSCCVTLAVRPAAPQGCPTPRPGIPFQSASAALNQAITILGIHEAEWANRPEARPHYYRRCLSSARMDAEPPLKLFMRAFSRRPPSQYAHISGNAGGSWGRSDLDVLRGARPDRMGRDILCQMAVSHRILTRGSAR